MNNSDMEQELESVYGFCHFEGQFGERWTEDELRPIVAVMTTINQAALKYFRCYDWVTRGINVGWTFYKRSSQFGPRYWTRLETWQSGSWGDDSIETIVQKLRNYYEHYVDESGNPRDRVASYF